MEIFRMEFPLSEEEKREAILKIKNEEEIVISYFVNYTRVFVETLEKLKPELSREQASEVESMIDEFEDTVRNARANKWSYRLLIEDILSSTYMGVGKIIKNKIFSDEELLTDAYERAIDSMSLSFPSYFNNSEAQVILQNLSEKINFSGWIIRKYQKTDGEYKRYFSDKIRDYHSFPVTKLIGLGFDISQESLIKMTYEDHRFLLRHDDGSFGNKIYELIALGPSGNPMKIRL